MTFYAHVKRDPVCKHLASIYLCRHTASMFPFEFSLRVQQFIVVGFLHSVVVNMTAILSLELVTVRVFMQLMVICILVFREHHNNGR